MHNKTVEILAHFGHLQEHSERKKTPFLHYFVCFLKHKKYFIEWEIIPHSQTLRYLRACSEGVVPHNVLYYQQQLSIAHYQVNAYANNCFEVSNAFKYWFRTYVLTPISYVNSYPKAPCFNIGNCSKH